MPRQVKGILFADFVRMIRASKNVSWDEHLNEQDLRWLAQRIDLSSWYPMEAYERMGLAIFEEIARGDFQAARQWGRRTIDELAESEPELFSAREPRETFMRFQVLRQALFNFPAAEVIAIRDGKAILEVRYGMVQRAEEAAVWQTIGFLERLLELSGATAVDALLESTAWGGASATRIVVTWTMQAREPEALDA